MPALYQEEALADLLGQDFRKENSHWLRSLSLKLDDLIVDAVNTPW